MDLILASILASAVTSGAVIVFAAIGEILSEQTGVLNLGVEGIMAMGAVSAILVVNGLIPNPVTGLFLAGLVGALLGAIFAFGTVTLKANQVLCGLAYSFFGSGLAGHIGRSFAGKPALARFDPIAIPFLSQIPLIGDALFNNNILVYIAYLLLPAIGVYLLYATRHGINIRAVGEDPAAADACGVRVSRIRFAYVCIGSALAAIGGAYLTLGLAPGWADGVTGGRGWIAIAMVIFSGWKPHTVLVGALLFGAVTSVSFMGQIHGWGIPSSFLAMLPYLVTIILVTATLLGGKKRAGSHRGIGPTALAVPYFRE